MDEVFGEENFRNMLLVRRFNKNLSRQFFKSGLPSLSIGAEYVLVYSKTTKAVINPVFRQASKERQTFGYWKGFWNAADRPTMRYKLLGVTPKNGQWKWKKEIADEAVENYEEYVQKFSQKFTLEEYWEITGKTKRFIRRSENKKGKNEGVEHWIPPSEGILTSSNWTDIIASEVLDDIGLHFDNPKNVNLIKRLLELGADKNSIILDSFAGSGTTAHAVSALNKEDGGNRKFILVECEDYADSITAERVRRVIKGIPNAKDEKLRNGLGGTFSYFELGDPIEMESILEGDRLPSFLELARYVFYTATGEEFDPQKVDENRNFIGESKEYEVYLFYKPDIEYLKSTALTLDRAKSLRQFNGKKRVVFAPSKYLDTDYLLEYRIDYCQLPFEIYKLKE